MSVRFAWMRVNIFMFVSRTFRPTTVISSCLSHAAWTLTVGLEVAELVWRLALMMAVVVVVLVVVPTCGSCAIEHHHDHPQSMRATEVRNRNWKCTSVVVASSRC